MESPIINNNNNDVDKDKISSILELFPNLSIKQVSNCLKSNNCNLETTINYLIENIDSLESINNDKEIKNTTMTTTTTTDDSQFKSPEEIENERLFKEFMKNEEINSERINSNKTHSCLVCYNDLPITDFYILDECNHKYCNDCLQAHYSMQVRSGYSDLKCPYPKCRYNPTYEEVKHILSNELFERYDKLLFNSHLGKDKNIRYCPVPDCGTPIILPDDIICNNNNNNGGRNNRNNRNNNNSEIASVQCPSPDCLSSYCFGCREETHIGLTCSEWADVKEEIAAYTTQVAKERAYEQQLFRAFVNEKGRNPNKRQRKRFFFMSRVWVSDKETTKLHPKTQQWLLNNTKQCPQCLTIIEKTYGCNHMTCIVCNENFCYGCGISVSIHDRMSFPCR